MEWRSGGHDGRVVTALIGIVTGLVIGAAPAAAAPRPGRDAATRRAVAQATGEQVESPGYVLRVAAGPPALCAAPSLDGTTILGTRFAAASGRTAFLAGAFTTGSAAGSTEIAFEFSARNTGDGHTVRLIGTRYGAQDAFVDDERRAANGVTSFWAMRLGAEGCIVFAVTPVDGAAQAAAALGDRASLPLALPLDPEPPGLVPPKLIHRVEPNFGEDARRAMSSGGHSVVRLLADIDAAGAVRFVHVIRRGSDGALDAEAAHAILQWRYSPATRDGAAVAVQFTVSVSFRVS